MDIKNNNLGLSIGFRNINGLSKEKSENDIYQKYINKFDIIFLSEIWKSETSINNLQHPVGFLHVSIYSKTKNKNGRASGGILDYYRKELSDFLSVLDKSYENIIWLKLSKGLIKTPMNVCIAGVYNSPKNSSYTKHNEYNITYTPRDQLSKFSPSDMVFVGGDLNKRIGTQNDFIVENKKDLNYLPQDYELDTIRSVRNNQDTSVNEYGQQLLDLCIETKLRILNGRTRGDLQGHLTHVGFHDCSTVDLVLTSEALLTK